MNGVIIAKQGYTTDSDSQNQYVNTKTPLFKLYKSDKGSRTYAARNLSFSGSPDFFTIPHNLGYCPMYWLFMDRAASGVRKMVLGSDAPYPDTSTLITCYVDNQNINVLVSSAFSIPVTGTFEFNYFIFYDKVGDRP